MGFAELSPGMKVLSFCGSSGHSSQFRGGPNGLPLMMQTAVIGHAPGPMYYYLTVDVEVEGGGRFVAPVHSLEYVEVQGE